jgi:hypothetical protein
MAGLGDSLTIGIVLMLVFGAVSFYIYSRLTQNEKRVGLLESLLLTLKMSTEASLSGPDMVEATSSPAPLEPQDVDTVSEETYADILKDIPVSVQTEEVVTNEPPPSEEVDAAELLRSLEPKRTMDANYEAMTLKELQALARQRGLPAVTRKRELIDSLKKQTVEGAESPQDGFELESI